MTNSFYRPQTKLRKGYGFTPVCHSVNGRGCLPQCILGYTHTPWEDTPLARHPPRGDTPQNAATAVLFSCIARLIEFSQYTQSC